MLFFSRGRGRGHAVPDAAIAAELRRIEPDLRLQFVSYGTGAATLAESGHEVVDLGLPEDAPFLESLTAIVPRLLEKPLDVVVAHEEFAVPPVARALGLPNCFIVDFFGPEKTIFMEALQYADEVLFIEQRGSFPQPSFLKGKVCHVGPVVRPMASGREDRVRAREALALPTPARVISVIPGSWATEKRAPALDLLAAAFARLPGPNKHLVWIAGHDHELLRERFRTAADVLVLRSFSPIEDVMVASDLVITKGNRGTTIEAASLGVPSVSLCYGINPIDEAILPRIRTNLALDARSLDAEFLAETIHDRLGTPPPPPAPEYRVGGAARAAHALARFVRERAAGRDQRPTSG